MAPTHESRGPEGCAIARTGDVRLQQPTTNYDHCGKVLLAPGRPQGLHRGGAAPPCAGRVRKRAGTRWVQPAYDDGLPARCAAPDLVHRAPQVPARRADAREPAVVRTRAP